MTENEKGAKTSYVVLRKVEEEGKSVMWREGPTVAAASAEAAIRSVASPQDSDAVYAAVPKRSFRAVRVSVSTQPVVKLS